VRVEVLSALLNGIALLGIAGFIGLEAWKRIMHPEPIRAGLMLGVALVGLLVNIAGMVLLSKSRNINVRAAFLHVASDAFASLGVVAAAVVVWITGYTLFDPLISLGIGIIIVVGSIALIREAVHVLIESVPRHIRLHNVQKELESVLGVSEVHDLHVWSIAHGLYSLSAHLVCSDSLTNNDLILEEARLKMRECFGIEHSTLQIESKRFHECEHTH
jgi:cobalt-zinc-cadmium efflux system protein